MTGKFLKVSTCNFLAWVPDVFFSGVKRPGRQADQSPSSSTEVQNVWSYTSSPPGVVFD